MFHIAVRAFPGTAPFVGAIGDVVWRQLLSMVDSRVQVHAACLMIDHLHVIATPGTVPLTTWVASMKSATTRAAWAGGHSGPIWQPSFFDRALKGPVEIESALAYVWTNPVEAGLVTDPGGWPWIFVASS